MTATRFDWPKEVYSKKARTRSSSARGPRDSDLPLPASPNIPLPVWLVALCLLMSPAIAADLQPFSENQDAGVVVEQGGVLVRLPVVEASLKAQLSGWVGKVEWRQSYIYRGDQPVSGRLVFPLPDTAAIQSLSMQVGDRLIEGEIAVKEQARARFDAALREGRKASLFDQIKPGLFQTRLSRIEPGEEITVRLGYVQPMEFRDGAFHWRFPLRQSMFPNDELSAPAIQAELDLRLGALEQVVSVAADLAIEAGQSPEEVHLRGELLINEGDMELRAYPRWQAQPAPLVFHEEIFNQDGIEDYWMVVLMPPNRGAAKTLQRDLVMVVDSSGSMHGHAMEQARQAVQRATTYLRPGDRFNVIEFDHRTRSLFATPQTLDQQARLELDAFLDEMEAEGGTHMGDALYQASLTEPGRLQQTVFLTDGAVSNEAQLLERLQLMDSPARMFSVALGSAPNAYFIRELARLGRGDYRFVPQAEEMAAAMDDVLSQLDGPVWSDLCMQWPWPVQASVDPLPDLYHGRPWVLMVAAGQTELSDSPWTGDQERLELCARDALGDQILQVDLGQAQPAPGLAAIWAKQRVRGLLDQFALGADRELVREEVQRLGLKHHLITPYTSLIAELKTDTASQTTALSDQASSRSAAYPQTGLGLSDSLGRGVLWLGFAAVLSLLAWRTRLPES